MKNYPLVSIISPNYNGEKYLHNYLNAILNQTYPNIELVITDDCSTDSSLSIIKSYTNKFKAKGYALIISKLEKNSGAAACINVCLKNIHGEYLIWMDSDDILYENAVELKVKYMLDNPRVEFLIGQGNFVRNNNLHKTVGVYRRTKQKNDNLFVDALKRKNMVYAAAHMVRVDAFKRAIPSMHIFESRQGQNFQILLPLAFVCKYDYQPISLFNVVIHSDSHSRRIYKYENRINREFGILNIIENTINSISAMKDEDKKKYINMVKMDILKRSVKISLKHFRIIIAKKYIKQILKLKRQIK